MQYYYYEGMQVKSPDTEGSGVGKKGDDRPVCWPRLSEGRPGLESGWRKRQPCGGIPLSKTTWAKSTIPEDNLDTFRRACMVYVFSIP